MCVCVGRQVFCSIQDDTCIGIIYIYIYESMVSVLVWTFFIVEY